MKNILNCFLIFMMLSSAQILFAQDTTLQSRMLNGPAILGKYVDPRDIKKYGIYFGLGSPYPSLLGINLAYNLANFRVTAGFAKVESTMGDTYAARKHSKANSYDVGTEYYFMHGESMRPLFGVHLGHVDLKSNSQVAIEEFDRDTTHAYMNFGIDYMSTEGFQFAVGYNQGIIASGNGSAYVNAGRFF